MEAYCFKCRSKREIKSPQQVTLKNGRPATQGVCPDCDTKVFRIGKAQIDGKQPHWREQEPKTVHVML